MFMTWVCTKRQFNRNIMSNVKKKRTMLHKLWVGEGMGLERFGDMRGQGVILEETM